MNCGSTYRTIRLVTLFDDLLASQFQGCDPLNPIKLRHPGDFAAALRTHVNHLNRTLKKVTGKTTSQLIAGKLEGEARVLLRHTDYTCSEIALLLGFETLPHFIRFFKSKVGKTPVGFRKYMP